MTYTIMQFVIFLNLNGTPVQTFLVIDPVSTTYEMADTYSSEQECFEAVNTLLKHITEKKIRHRQITRTATCLNEEEKENVIQHGKIWNEYHGLTLN